MLTNLRSPSRRSRLLFFFTVVSTICYFSLFYLPASRFPISRYIVSVFSPEFSHSSARPSLPPDYARENTEPEHCQKRYSVAYLTALRDNRQSYCNPNASQSSFDCFSIEGGNSDSRTDSLCVAKNLPFTHNELSTSFILDCATQLPLNTKSFPDYMYDTGPNHILSNFFSISPGPISADRPRSALPCSGHPKFTILLKREGNGNLWHVIQQLFALYLTIDVLRMTSSNTSKSDAQPILMPEDVSSTQILLLDDFGEGPYLDVDLWKLFAPLPILRLEELRLQPGSTCLENVIIPLAGGTTPLWYGDWSPGICTQSVLLDVFVERVLTFYDFGASSKSRQIDDSAPLTLTFIDRKQTRILINATELFNKFRTRFPDVHIQMIDFAAIPLREQIRVIQGTDILVGVHGAGMAHTMFLPPRSSVVEILPHGLEYPVFRNLAKLKGHTYFRAHGDRKSADIGVDADWHGLDVVMEESRFFELVETGIRAMLHRGNKTIDVI